MRHLGFDGCFIEAGELLKNLGYTIGTGECPFVGRREQVADYLAAVVSQFDYHARLFANARRPETIYCPEGGIPTGGSPKSDQATIDPRAFYQWKGAMPTNYGRSLLV
jgi:hypothetical protein